MQALRISPIQDSLFESIQLFHAYERAINANIISTITDQAGTIVYANEKFCEVCKAELNAIIGQNHRIVNSGYHPPEFFKNMWQTIHAGEVWLGEIRNKASDGSFYWVDTVIVPIRDEKDTITHYLSLRTLITERKILQEKKADYVSSLEVLLVMTSHNIKKPLAECLKKIRLLNSDRPLVKSDLNIILADLAVTVKELDSFTKNLNDFIREIDV